MTNFSKLLKLVMIMCLILALTGCGYSAKERALMKQYSEQAKVNAKEYILDKYGFEADIVDTYLEKVDPGPVPDFSPSPTSRVYVGMRYNNKKFYVYITGEKTSKDGCDNYQFDIIKNDFMEYVKDKLKVDPVMCNFYYGKDRIPDDKYNGLISKQYDGTNLQEILSKGELRVVFEYINGADLKSIHNSNYFDQYLKDGLILFVKYPSKDAYDKVSTHLYNIFGTPQIDDLYKNAIYIDNALLISSVDDEYYEFNLNEYDGFYYSVFDNNGRVNFSKIMPEDPHKWDGRGVTDGKIISDAYSVETTGSPVTVYFPVSKIHNPDEFKNISAASSYIYNGQRYYGANNLTYDKVGDYYVFNLYLKNYSGANFVIMGDN